MMTTNLPTVNPVATGARIRQLRMQRGITVREIVEFLGLTSEQAVYKWQRGECLPSIDNLIGLSILFRTYIEDILVAYGDYEMSSRILSKDSPGDKEVIDRAA